MLKSIKLAFFVLAILIPAASFCQFSETTGVITSARWKSGVPLGGIGCGKIEMLTDGGFGNFSVNHNWDRPTGIVRGAFFAVYAGDGNTGAARVLKLRSDRYQNTTMIDSVTYFGRFPVAELNFYDPLLPLDISLEAFSPLIPNNIKDSSLPCALFNFTVTNRSDRPLDAALLFSMENLIGWGGRKGKAWDSRDGNKQEILDTAQFSGLLFTTSGSYEGESKNVLGEYLIAVQKEPDLRVTYCQNWDAGAKAVSFWDSFALSGILTDMQENGPSPAGAVCAKIRLKPKEQRRLSFVFVWHMPFQVSQYREKTFTGNFYGSKRDVYNAFDGKQATRWSNGYPKVPGEAFLFGLGRAETITKVVYDTRSSPNDYPEGYILEVSLDGVSWQKVKQADAKEASGQQQGGLLEIAFSPACARYIKITQLGRFFSWFWSIHEISVYNNIEKIDFKPEDPKALLQKIEYRTVTADNSHYYANYFSGAPSIAGYALENKDRLLAQTKEWQDLVFRSTLPFWLRLKLINCAFPMYANTVLTKDGRFSVLESPIDMGGALGTMDQRMAAHAFYTQIFPELDKSELELFAKCQPDDGQITHFCGNVHEVVGSGEVGYGTTGWPDLSCSWIMQVLKLYRWTGDADFLKRMYPRLKKAAAFLKSADQDSDFIPEGGSTYDYENLPRGAFIYSASCYLGALNAAKAAAEAMGDAESAEAYAKDFENARKSVIDNMWNGAYFIKWCSHATGEKNVNSFIAQFAGDWLSRLCGTGRTIPEEYTNPAVKYLLATHLDSFFPVPPMEVKPNGKPAVEACYMLQHEPYLGMEAIYEGFVDKGLEVIRRVFYVSWVKTKNPWCQSLAYSLRGEQGGLISYMTCPTTWHVLNALSGTTLDINAGMLCVRPQLFSGSGELHMPVFFSNFWVWLDFVPSRRRLTLTIIKIFSDKPMELSRVVFSEDLPPVNLKKVFKVEAGSVLDLSGYYIW